jgi:hypothetical protein
MLLWEALYAAIISIWMFKLHNIQSPSIVGTTQYPSIHILNINCVLDSVLRLTSQQVPEKHTTRSRKRTQPLDQTAGVHGELESIMVRHDLQNRVRVENCRDWISRGSWRIVAIGFVECEFGVIWTCDYILSLLERSIDVFKWLWESSCHADRRDGECLPKGFSHIVGNSIVTWDPRSKGTCYPTASLPELSIDMLT